MIDTSVGVLVSGNAMSGTGGDPYIARSADGGDTWTPAATQPSTTDLVDTIYGLARR